MITVFKGQSLLEIHLDTAYDLSVAQELRIYYKKPDETVGYWTGEIEATTKIKYVIPNATTIDQSGTWKFQSAVIVDTREARGEIVEYEFAEPL